MAIIKAFGTRKLFRGIPFSAASGFRKLLPEGKVYVLNITDLTHTGSSFVVYKSKWFRIIFIFNAFGSYVLQVYVFGRKIEFFVLSTFCTRNVNQLIMTMFTKWTLR